MTIFERHYRKLDKNKKCNREKRKAELIEYQERYKKQLNKNNAYKLSREIARATN